MARKNTTARAVKSRSNTMWGGRYKLGPAEIMERINASIDFDRRLYAQDIAGSLAHCDMLGAQGNLTAQGGRAIRRGLARVRGGFEGGRVQFSTQAERTHFKSEVRPTADEVLGAPGRSDGLGRKRNRVGAIGLDLRRPELVGEMHRGKRHGLYGVIPVQALGFDQIARSRRSGGRHDHKNARNLHGRRIHPTNWCTT